MGFKKNNPGCKCCQGCTICDDDFTRADDTDIDTGSPCGWTESSGSWDIHTDALRCTSAGIAICDAVDTSSSLAQSVTVVATHSTSSSSVDLILAYYDASNYVYARFTFGSNTLAIRQVVAGSDSNLKSGSTTLNTSSYYTLTVCSDGAGHVKATANGISVSTEAATIHASATKSGLAANGSGTATFNSFNFSHSFNASEFPDCDECFACTACTTPAPPKQIRLVASGIGDGIAGCAAICNGTFDLDIICDCYWWYEFPTPAGGVIGWLVFLSTGGGSNLRIDAYLVVSGGSVICTPTPSHTANWWASGQPRADCLTWSSKNLPNTSFFGGTCVFGAGISLVAITSIP